MGKKKLEKPNSNYRYQTVIRERVAMLSTAEQAVAEHLAAHPEQIPFETANSLGKRLGVSAMTVGRALKALGYKGLSELRLEMRSQAVDAAPWKRHLTAPHPAPELSSLDRRTALRDEIEAIESVHALAETARWRDSVKLLASADHVYVAGFQTERGVAITFADLLAYVRGGVHRLSVEDRAFADIRHGTTGKNCIVLLDSRRYCRWFRQLSEKAAGLGLQVIIVTDAYCSWASEISSIVLQARTDSGRFWDNNGPLLSLLNLLVEDVIEELGEAVYARLDAASEFGANFMGFDRVYRRRNASQAENKSTRPPPVKSNKRGKSGGQ